MRNLLFLSFLVLSSCASIEYRAVYMLYGVEDLPHDKFLFYGDKKFTKIAEYDTEEECNKNKIKGIMYTQVICIEGWRRASN
jgi:hypothetical protein